MKLRIALYTLLATTVATLVAANAVYALPSATNTDQSGPLATKTAEYHFPASIDNDVLPNVMTELWARVYWPDPLVDTAAGATPEKRPLILFLHGNHATCGTGTAPRNDNSCAYTNEGSCGAGEVVTPNHEGYNYVAESLASWGYVVVSINANRGITCGSGDVDDWGLNLARGRLILKHIEMWNEWSSKGGAPTELGATDAFVGAIDIGQVGLMGHSRGGEGIRAALNLYRDKGSVWQTKIPKLDIRALFEIGAVDGQSSRILNAPSVAWNQLLPLCDGDVYDLQGRAPFNRMLSDLFANNASELRPSPKSLLMVWGANHNFFNTEWQNSDSWGGCEPAMAHKPLFQGNYFSLEQQSIGRQSMLAFFRAHLGPNADPKLAATFDSAYSMPNPLSTVTTIDREFIPSLDAKSVLLVDDFTMAAGTNPSGEMNDTTGVTIVHEANAEPPRALIEWTKAGVDQMVQLNFRKVAAGADLTKYDSLDFRIGRDYNNDAAQLIQAVDLSVALVSDDGTISTAVTLASYSNLLGPANAEPLTQTARVPLADFAGFDRSHVRGVRFTFNKTESAKIRLAQVRFGVDSTKIPSIAVAPTAVALRETSKGFLDLSRGMTPLRLPAPAFIGRRQRLANAIWMRPTRVPSSRQLHGMPAFELSVGTTKGFPVRDELPVLNIENKIFPISRYANNGKTNVLIFTVPTEAVRILPDWGQAQVQYGIKDPTEVWKLPDFSRGMLGE